MTTNSADLIDAPTVLTVSYPASNPAAKDVFIPWVLLAVLITLPWICSALGQEYYLGFFRRMLILILAVSSLNLLVGYGGLVALGHAGFIGVGAYTLAALTEAKVESVWILWIGAAVVAGLVSAAIGSIALRTRGVYFIMITLAFAQMLYYLAVSLRVFGGDDGYNLAAKPSLGLGLNISDDHTFYWVVLAIVALAFWGFNVLLASPFGHALQAARDNETRATALGYPVYRIRLSAFILAGALAGLAGAMMIVHNGFITPGSMQWSESAILVVILALGGLGRRFGPAIGVVVWMSLEEILKQYTDYWHWPIGLILIVVMLIAPAGLSTIFARKAP